MSETNELLRAYAAHGSEEAFTELVRRYVDFVHSAAVRQVNGNRTEADDIVQIVFTDLARMARTLRSESHLGGWLHRHTVFVGGNFRRREQRRREREQISAELNLPEAEQAWEAAAALLDEAVNALGESDRKAILLRFFEKQDLRTLGVALGVGEDAAQKRVARAVDRLREYFARRGASASAASLALWLGDRAVVAAGTGLVARIAANALVGAAGATSLTPSGKLVGFSKPTSALAGLALGLGLAVSVWQWRTIRQLRTERLATEISSVAIETEDVDRAVRRQELQRLRADGLELARLRAEAGRLRGDIARRRGSAPMVGAQMGGEPGEDRTQPSAVRSFSTAVVKRVERGGSVMVGGWQTEPGKRTVLLITSSDRDQGDAVNLMIRWISFPNELLGRLGFPEPAAEVDSWSASLENERTTLFLEALRNGGGFSMMETGMSTSAGIPTSIGSDHDEELNGQVVSIGPKLDLLPTLAEDGHGLNLEIKAQINLPPVADTVSSIPQ